MSGVLFIVNVPRKEHEESMKKDKKNANDLFDNDEHGKTFKIEPGLQEKGLSNNSFHSNPKKNTSDVNISKCKSTDSLNTEDKKAVLCKTQSEMTLNVNSFSQNKSNNSFKSSSEDMKGSAVDQNNGTDRKLSIKQVIKQRRNKLKITRPVRGVDILGAFDLDTPLETILTTVIERLDVKNAAWSTTRDNTFWQVTFSLESGNVCEELLQVLRTLGVGTRYQSTVSVVPCALYFNSRGLDNVAHATELGNYTNGRVLNSIWSRFSSSVRARTNLAQVLHDVKADAALTFDWLFLLVVAAFVAAIGLVENSTVILVASMLISPLMGPITAATLGTAVKDRSLQQLGVVHEMLGLFLSLVIGFIFGLTISIFDERYGVLGDWPTYEMITRCELRSLWVGVMVAIPSGAGVALAVLGEYTASLVGVAISASLLPPAVNAGLLWAMALVRLAIPNDETNWTVVKPSELAMLGSASLCLTLINIVCIFIAGVAVYKVKRVYPLDRNDISWWRRKGNLQTSQNYNEHGHSTSWNVYSKWCNDIGGEKDVRKQDTTGGQVQSDTVTYRRPPTAANRLRAQNIEAYCLQKTQNDEDYFPLASEETIKYETHSNDNTKIPFKVYQQPDKSNNSKSGYPGTDCGLFHNGYQNQKEKPEPGLPTIEPSQNFTVDSKNSLLLRTQYFDV